MPFAKGKSGNPKGRPAGSKNKSTIIKEALKDFDLNKLCNLDYSFLIEKKAA